MRIFQSLCSAIGHSAARYRGMAPLPNSQSQMAQAVSPGGPLLNDAGAVTALVPSDPSEQLADGIDLEGPIARLPVEIDVAVPVRGFRVRNLLALRPGTIVASQWPHGEDLPVTAGDQPLAWSEFEVVDSHLAVRITRLP